MVLAKVIVVVLENRIFLIVRFRVQGFTRHRCVDVEFTWVSGPQTFRGCRLLFVVSRG